MLKLGYNWDAGVVAAPVDLTTAGFTGKRTMLRNAQSVSFLLALGAAASGTEDVVLTLNEHTAASSGTTTALANITTAWIKSATTLANTESWTKISQAAGSTLTIAGATYAAKQALVVVQVNTKDLDDGYDYISLSAGDPGTVSRLGACIALLSDMTVRRDPANLQPLLF